MSKLNYFILIFFILRTIKNISGQTIYEQQDNESIWAGQCQNGINQTPVNLTESQATYRPRNLIRYTGYGRNIGNVRIVNNGYTIQVSFPNASSVPKVTFNKSTYVLQQFHFHWGASEHALNSRLYDGEIHLVHLDSNNKILVLGALLQKISNINNIITNIFKKAATSLIDPSGIDDQIDGNWRQLLNEINMDKYLNYMGSLTTPNCTEGVTWIVYPELIPVDSTAIEDLKNLRDNNGNRLLFTNRRLQPLNGRKVYKTYTRSFKINFLG